MQAWQEACPHVSCLEASPRAAHECKHLARALPAVLRESAVCAWGAFRHSAPGPAMVQLLTGGVRG